MALTSFIGLILVARGHLEEPNDLRLTSVGGAGSQSRRLLAKSFIVGTQESHTVIS